MKKKILCAFLVFSSSMSMSANANSHAQGGFNIPWQNGDMPCWDQAGAYHNVDPWLLYAIAKVESSYNPRAVNGSNKNGTEDVGLMQINSIWYGELRKHGISRENLFNACASTFIGAWILAKNIKKYGYTWEAIATYNTGSLGTPARQRIGREYARKVYAAYEAEKLKNRRN